MSRCAPPPKVRDNRGHLKLTMMSSELSPSAANKASDGNRDTKLQSSSPSEGDVASTTIIKPQPGNRRHERAQRRRREKLLDVQRKAKEALRRRHHAQATEHRRRPSFSLRTRAALCCGRRTLQLYAQLRHRPFKVTRSPRCFDLEISYIDAIEPCCGSRCILKFTWETYSNAIATVYDCCRPRHIV